MPGPSRPGKAHPESGKVSRYEIVELLGEAASGPVYKAWDPELERSVALRLIPPGLAGQGEERQQLLREVRAVSLLEHPNVCPVHEMGEADDGSLFLVSGYCAGETLAERMQRGPVRFEGAVELAGQVAAAVAQAHEQGIVHGRLRPANVRVGADGQARVVDFGLSRLEERTWATWQGGAMVSEYLAPELLAGEAASARSDVWAIGALLFAMMTGKPPSRLGLAGKEPRPATREGMPEDLARILDRALAARPSERHARAGDLRDDLRALRRSGSGPSASGARTPGKPPGVAGARRLSQYRIGELLGGGGMGVVYRAEDLQLGRTVALKFLPLELAGEPAAKARFLQEARAASALDHPNICTIYEVGETDEHQLYLAMPCYDGETLKAKISRGPLPVPEALDCALQVARGLAKAHRQGIVHRDVKPANLMVTGDGLVKILDFGVAKLAGEVGLTRTGSAVGTPAYMAPEQIRGEPVDARADLWSLGAVLYEMVTGRRPFPGESQEAVAQAILTREPEPLARLRPDAPTGLERIVRGLLAKDPAQRYPTADALTADLRLLLGLPAASGAASVAPVVAPVAPRKPIRVTWRQGLAAALALLGLTSAVALLLRLRAPSAGGEPPSQATFVQLTDREGRETFPSLSPDGNYFLYAKLDGGDQDVFLQRVGGGNPINLTADSPADDSQPAYSPDGSLIAFRSERGGGGLFLMGATGESVRRITDFGFQPSWSPDGRELAFSTQAVTDPKVRSILRQVWRVEVATGRRRMVAKGDAAQPSWSPGGHRIAVSGMADDRWKLWTLPAGGGTLTPVLDAGEKSVPWTPVWSPDGRHLYFLSNRGGSVNLWRLPIDERSGRVLGEAEPVTTPAQSVDAFSLSRDGSRILYSTRETRSIVESVGFDPGTGRTRGAPRTVARIMRKIFTLVPSPRGDWLVMAGESPAGEDLFVMRPDGSGFRQLTDDPHHDRFPDWSADGKRIFFFTDRSGRLQIWTVQPDGGGLRAVITRPKAEPFNPHPSPDGRWLACNVGFDGAVLFDLRQPHEPPVPLAIRGKEDHILIATSWSADGTELAGQLGPRKVMQDLGDKGSMAVYSLATQSVEVLPDVGEWPRFAGDGPILLFNREGAIHAIDRRTRRSWPVAAPPEGSTFSHIAPARDGRTLYTVRILNEGDVWLMDRRSREISTSSAPLDR